MKAQELRIGNLINVHVDGEMLPVKLNGIVGGSVQFEFLPNDKEWKVGRREIIECEPIPLTEEWLLKLGFEKQDNLWHKDIALYPCPSGIGFNYNVSFLNTITYTE